MNVRRASLTLLSTAALVFPAAARAQNRAAVEFGRTGYRLTSLGEKRAVYARVLDARRRAVPNAPIAYRTSDPTIAIVSNQGVVQSKKVGRTKVWAVSGRDSASALIVVDQWATTFAFVPATVQFDAIGKRLALQVQLRDAVGNAIPDQGRRTAQCRIRDEKVATLAPNGQLVSKANGTTFVRCTDRGIADSVRVEVRQRPARAMITDKLSIGTVQVGDTFRLHVRAVDPQGDSIINVRATWASLVPGIVNIDPLSGAARAIGPGTTRVVTQVGDATDTVAVVVQGTALPGAVGDAAVDSAAGSGRGQPTLHLDQIFPMVGDTAKVTFSARDALGAAIPNPDREVALISSNEKVVKILPGFRALAVDTGIAVITGRFSAAGTPVLDSMQVNPRPRGRADATATVASANQPVEFKRPVFPVDSQKAFNRRQIDDQMKMIVDSGIGRTTTGRALAFEVLVGTANHLSKLTPTLSESRTGLVFGGMGQLAPFRQLVATGSFRKGTLTDKSGLLSEDIQLAEVEGHLMYWPANWFGIGGGYLLRGENTELSHQKWTAPSATAVLRGTFVGNAVRVSTGGSIFLKSTFSGRTDRPEATSFAGESAVDLRLGYLDAGFAYYVERFTFAAAGTATERSDLFSTLRFRIGLKFGGRK